MATFNLTQDVWTQIIIGGSSLVDQYVQVTQGKALISLGTFNPAGTVIDSGSFDDKVIYVPAGVSVYARPAGSVPVGITTGNYGAGQSTAGYQLADAWAAAVGVGVFVSGAQPGVDARPLILAALAKAVAMGGGVIVLPNIGGYTVSDEIKVTTSNIYFELHDNVTLNKTSKSSAIRFEGAFGTHLTNVGIISGDGFRTIDGNGAAMKAAGYTYTAGVDVDYAAVCFKYCTDPVIKGVHVKNGLVNSVEFFGCRRPRIEELITSAATFDNGLSVNYGPGDVAFSETDPATWCNAYLRNITSFGNESLGITNFGAVGFTAENCLSYANGNDDVLLPHNGGGISVENGISNSFRNLRTTLINCRAVGNRNYGIFVSAPGVSIIGGGASGTLAPVNKPNTLSLLGSNLALLGGASVRTVGVALTDAGGRNVSMLSTGVAITANIATGSNTLTVTATPSAIDKVSPGMIVRAAGIPTNTYIGAQLTGATGLAGTYSMVTVSGAVSNATATTNGLTVNAESFPSLDFDGDVRGAVSHNIYGQGIERLTVSARSRIERAGNGTGFSAYGIQVVNSGAAYRPGQGRCEIAGFVNATTNTAVNIDGVGITDIGAVKILDQNSGAAAAPAITVQGAVSRAWITGPVTNRDGSAKTTYIVSIAVAVANAMVTPGTISGDFNTGAVLNNSPGTIPRNA